MSLKRGFVTWMAGYLGMSRRRIAQLARKGAIPTAARSNNGYTYAWGEADPAKLANWILHQKRFRKGKRKGPPKRKKRRMLLDEFGRAVHYAANLTRIDQIEIFRYEIRRAPIGKLRQISNSLFRLRNDLEVVQHELERRKSRANAHVRSSAAA